MEKTTPESLRVEQQIQRVNLKGLMEQMARLQSDYENDLSKFASVLQYIEAHIHVLERVQSDHIAGKPIHYLTNGEDRWVDYQAYFSEYFACQALADAASLIERPSLEYAGATVWGG